MVYFTPSPVLFVVTAAFSSWLSRRHNSADDSDKADSIDDGVVPTEKNEVLTLIQNRRSIFPKQYSPSMPVPKYIIEKMLEAARWSPSHHLTQPWYFIVFETESSRQELGKFLADSYKKTTSEGAFIQQKYEKKLQSVMKSTFVISICVRRDSHSKVPEVEDICSVAIAVQNMHLVATEYNVGAYWSSGSIYDAAHKKDRCIVNPAELREFLQLPTPESFCIGWFYVGNYEGKFQKGRRDNMDSTKVIWR